VTLLYFFNLQKIYRILSIKFSEIFIDFLIFEIVRMKTSCDIPMFYN